MDSGWTQILVHQSLVQPGALEAEWVEVKCVYGDTSILWCRFCYKGKTQGVKAAVGQRLLHPLILDTN